MRLPALALGCVLLAGCGDSAPQVAESALDRQRGMRLYQRDCLLCHGKTGAGGVMGAALEDIPSLAGSQRSVEEIADIVLEGRGRMRGWKGMLERSEALDIAAYIRAGLLDE